MAGPERYPKNSTDGIEYQRKCNDPEKVVESIGKDFEDQSMDNRIIGGCACRAIQYESDENPNFSLICQCRQCQHITGSGHAAQFAVAEKTTRIQGEISWYELEADSGNVVCSGFCGHCGSPVLKKTTGMPESLFFHAGTLDDPSIFKPEMVVHESSKQPWDHVDPVIPRK